MAIILVIDDEPAVRTLIGRVLKLNGHEVILAEDGEAGLREFRARPANLVITDLSMPKQAGLETMALLRQESPTLPIIAISGHAPGESLLAAVQNLGVRKILQKPFTVDTLLKAIQEAL